MQEPFQVTSICSSLATSPFARVSFPLHQSPLSPRLNHYHTRKFERFAVIKGKANLQLRRIGTDEVMDFEIDADKCPGFVDMPIWFTHNITNIGDDTLYTMFWINEFFDAEDPDTYFEQA